MSNTSSPINGRQVFDSVELQSKTFISPEERISKISNETLISERLIPTCEQTPSTEKKNASYRKWFVLAAGFYANICNGFAFTMAVLNAVFLTEFGRSKAETALVQSSTTGMFLIAGIFFGTLVSKYGARKVGMTAGVLAGLGCSISYFATSIPFLVATLGVLTGLGLSASFIGAGTSVGEYFDGKARLLALSFLSFGSGCGTIIYTYLLDFLTREYGWRGCLLIVGAQMMNMVPCFAICKPRYVGVLKPDLIEGERNGNSNNHLRNCCKRLTIKERTSKDSAALSGVLLKRNNFIDAKFKTILRNKAYVLFTLSLVVALPSFITLIFFLVNFLQMAEFDHEQTLSLYVCLNIFNTIFRLSPGVLKLVPHFSVLLIPALFTSVGAICCALLPFATSYIHHMLLLGCFGIGRGRN